jgi:Mannitol repressor
VKNFHQHVEETRKMIASFERETDRSAVLLSTSFLDNKLEEGIRVFLVDDDIVNKLFEGYAPLSTFSAKIDLAFAIGLISKETRQDLHTIRRIRNHFAHRWEDLQFDKQPISDLCSNILAIKTLPYKRNEKDELFLVFGGSINDPDVIRGDDFSVFTRKQQFITTVNILSALIHATAAEEKVRKSLNSKYFNPE